jgi:hypothetical protein
MRKSYLLLAGALALGIATAIGTSGAEAGPGALCRTAADGTVQLAQTEGSAQPLTCCFADLTDESCAINAPTRNGCEWALAYQCPDAAYKCDDEARMCQCDAAGAGAAP